MRASPLAITSQRRGTNLIELVVVMSLQAVLLATGVGLIGRMLESEQAGRLNLQTLRTIDALVEQFRQDVNAAGDASLAADGNVLLLQLTPQRSVAYETHDGRLMRIERDGNELRRAEAYRLPATWQVSFESFSEGPVRRLRLSLTENAFVLEAKARSLTCEAVLGRDAETGEVKS